MEVVLLIALVALLASGARFLGMMEARAGRTGDGVVDGLNGLFALSREYSRSAELGWPHGVQEEDRDRVWTWAPPAEPAESDVIDVQADLIDADIAVVRVQRVR